MIRSGWHPRNIRLPNFGNNSTREAAKDGQGNFSNTNASYLLQMADHHSLPRSVYWYTTDISSTIKQKSTICHDEKYPKVRHIRINYYVNGVAYFKIRALGEWSYPPTASDIFCIVYSETEIIHINQLLFTLTVCSRCRFNGNVDVVGFQVEFAASDCRKLTCNQYQQILVVEQTKINSFS